MLYSLKLISLFGGLVVVLNMLVPIHLPDGAVQAFADAITYAYQFNHVVDIDTLLICFFLALGSEAMLLVWRAFNKFIWFIK